MPVPNGAARSSAWTEFDLSGLDPVSHPLLQLLSRPCRSHFVHYSLIQTRTAERALLVPSPETMRTSRKSEARRGQAKRTRGSFEQLRLPLVRARDGTRRGGARSGAGRKRLEGASTPHRARPPHRAAEPVHVTLRAGLGPLRSQFLFPSVRLAISRATRRAPERFRVVQFSVQHNHVHLVVEAANKRELSAGVRSVSIRIARYVNDLLQRRGRLWADRWHGRALRSPREVRNALVYVLANFRKHTRSRLPPGIDPYSAGAWFEGWQDYSPHSDALARFAARPPPGVASEPRSEVEGDEFRNTPVMPARRWLTTTGWRRHGLIGLDELPRS